MTKAELIKRLAAGGSDEAQAEAKMILTELFGASAQTQLLEPEREYSDEVLEPLLQRRAEHEPLAYILGYAYFCDEKYYLSTDTLIPRADTEMLVETAVGALRNKGRFVDLCTGSGCVAISTLARRPDLSAIAIDISEGACEMAKKNARENGVADKLEVRIADVKDIPLTEKYDAILSNPPYIRRDVIDTLSAEVLHEPRIALDGGEDGMDFYRFMISEYEKHLEAGGFFAFEIGYDQTDLITEIAEEHDMDCMVLRDYSDNPRVAVIRRRSEVEDTYNAPLMSW